jgi:hypothetical protein
MALQTISIPAEHVGALRRVLLRAHADRAAALRAALDAYEESHQGLDDIHGALVELVDLDEAIGQLGWTSVEAGPVELTAHPEVLADALQTAGLEDGGFDTRARARVARLLVISDFEARVVLSLVDDGHLTLTDLERRYELSPGGAVALAERLDKERLVMREPNPRDPSNVRLRLSPGAEVEASAALHGLINRLE